MSCYRIEVGEIGLATKRALGRGVVSALVVLFANADVASEERQRIGSLKQVCITDQATGFNWENGQWNRTSFVEETYIVSKIEPPRNMSDAESSGRRLEWLACGNPGPEWEGDDDHRFYSACLMSHQLGAKSPRFMGCKEMHVRKDGTWTVLLACSDANFFFELNGQFHLGNFHGDVDTSPKDDYKDSLVISVGRCAALAS